MSAAASAAVVVMGAGRLTVWLLTAIFLVMSCATWNGRGSSTADAFLIG